MEFWHRNTLVISIQYEACKAKELLKKMKPLRIWRDFPAEVETFCLWPFAKLTDSTWHGLQLETSHKLLSFTQILAFQDCGYDWTHVLVHPNEEAMASSESQVQSTLNPREQKCVILECKMH